MQDRHQDIVRREESALLIVDVQERFRPHIDGFDAMAAAIRLLTCAADRLGVPTAYSEQYPKGLGVTVDELTEVMPESASRFEKLEISSVAAPAWHDLPGAVRRARQLVVVGIESHVCVRQTALDAIAAGYQVHVPADAVASRNSRNRTIALEGLSRAGARVDSVESILFDWLEVAGSDEFKDVQRLIKQHDELALHA